MLKGISNASLYTSLKCSSGAPPSNTETSRVEIMMTARTKPLSLSNVH